jgi:signal transduction histidine kinase
VTQATAIVAEQRWKVVVIDDSPDDRAEVRRLLLQGSRRRYDFIEAETGSAGLRAILGAHGGVPDCVVLDYHLPDADAPEVLAGLAGSDDILLCPVVVVTGRDDHDFGRAALRAGAQDFVGKAWMTAGSLTRTVESAVERWAMARELNERDARLRSALEGAKRGAAELQVRELELREALDQAEAAVRARDQLVSLVSHDLKNPLSTLLMGIAILESSGGAGAPDVLVRMKRQAQRMSHMIDDLLDGAQRHAGKHLELQLAETDLVQLVHGLAADHQHTAPHHRIEVSSATDVLMGTWDARRLDRVVNNLLSNAIKYSPSGGEVRLDLSSALQANATWAVLRVRDEGIGIAAHDQAHVFYWYSRADNARETAIHGTGVGLAAARDIVEQHGGSISVESEPGKGSTFTVRLPTHSPLPLRRSEPAPSHILPVGGAIAGQRRLPPMVR